MTCKELLKTVIGDQKIKIVGLSEEKGLNVLGTPKEAPVLNLEVTTIYVNADGILTIFVDNL